MPRTKEHFKAIREESRLLILHTALILFTQFGYEKTSVRMIAREAGISQGLMYNYFDSKEALLKAIFIHGKTKMQQSLSEIDQLSTATPNLEKIIRHSLSMVEQHQQFWQLFYSLNMQPVVLELFADEDISWLSSIQQHLKHYFETTNSGNPDIQASMLYAIIDGIAQHYVRNPDNYPLEDVLSELISRFCPVHDSPEVN
jgi:AcrR family transcriptional regulator